METPPLLVDTSPDSPTGARDPDKKSRINSALTKTLPQDFNLKLRVGSELLGGRSVSASGSSSDVPDSPGSESALQEFENLAQEFEAGKYKVGPWIRLFTWLKEIFSTGFDRNVDLAGRAFNKIENKPAFLKATFNLIALPENKGNIEENTKNLLKLCRKADPKLIVDGFCAISNPEAKLAVFGALVNRHSPRFEPNKLDPDQAKKLADALLGVGDKGAKRLAESLMEENWLMEQIPRLEEESEDKFRAFVQVLLESIGGMAKLARLLVADKFSVKKFPELKEESKNKFSSLVWSLLKADGARKLAQLLISNKFSVKSLCMLNGNEAQVQAFIQVLLETSEGAGKLAQSLIANKFPVDNFPTLSGNEPQFQAFIKALFEVDDADKLAWAETNVGTKKLAELVIKNKVSVEKFLVLSGNKPQFQAFIQVLLKTSEGTSKLKQLLVSNKLPNLEFVENQSGQFAPGPGLTKKD
ncbi:MAG: hypothetical protein LBC11_03325 [Puniceicoccales bacterium]|jgi:hypothetical protein|nr:hypothetical protein [Puniceicoccales bacterium]